MSPDLHILGGGPAGLAAAHFARKRGLELRLYEAGPETGGNCRTLRLGDCLYDTGAHRLHLRIPEATGEFRALLGDDLLEVDAPSAVAVGGRLLRFPPSPADLLRNLGPKTLARVALELALGRSQGPEDPRSFAALARGKYGKTLADLFLLNYTRKLWGRDPAVLSPEVGGGRLRGLDLKSLLLEKLGLGSGPAHLEGRFLYPKGGIGALSDALARGLPSGSVRTGTAVTKVRHDGGRILGVTLDGKEEVLTPRVVSTLPLPYFLEILDPKPPLEILEIARGIAFRQVLLAAVVLERDRFTPNASLYFPDPAVPFTRVYEPKNRSAAMAPEGRTCLVLEIPCDAEDGRWKSGIPDVTALLAHLDAVRPISGARVAHTAVHRIPNAYPILESGVEHRLRPLFDYCGRFSNLTLLGRNALFRYAHLHDLFRQAAQAFA